MYLRFGQIILVIIFIIVAYRLFVTSIFNPTSPTAFKNESSSTPVPSDIEEITRIPPTVAVENMWYVSPQGNNSASGKTPNAPFQGIQHALERAYPGDVIYLLPGRYAQDLSTVRSGEKGSPITIRGGKEAIIVGAGSARIVQIFHDYIILDGFTIDGKHSSGNSASSYRDKLIYAQGKDPYDGVNNVLITNMLLQNAGGECVRFRYYASYNEFSYNSVKNCGAYDYLFDDGGKNGEGLYIGTAPEQRDDGKNPTSDNDESNYNLVHHNSFNTQGNECVDVKENSKFNIIEYNSCTGQKDPESGGMDARGDHNIFRHNDIFDNEGAGVRLGGDSSQDGIMNQVYNNTIRNNKSGGIKIMRSPQEKICGNSMENNLKGDAVGEYRDEYSPQNPC